MTVRLDSEEDLTWMDDDDDDDAPGAERKADWSEEEGPRGGTRWVSSEGEVRYREPADAGHEAGEGEIAASDLAEGDSVVIDGEEAEVSTLKDMGGGFYVAGRTDGGDVATARVGPNHDFEVPGDGGDRTAPGDDGLRDWESTEDFRPQDLGSYKGDDFVHPEHGRVRLSRAYRSEVRFAPVNDDMGYDRDDMISADQDDFAEAAELIDTSPDPSDLNRDERMEAASLVSRGVLSGAGGNVETDWREYGEVLDRMGQDELEQAAREAVLGMPETSPDGVRKGDAPLERVMGAEHDDADMGVMDTVSHTQGVACLTSRMEPDRLVGLAEEILGDPPDPGDVRTPGAYSDEDDAVAIQLSSFYNAAVAFAPDQSARDEISRRFDAPENGYRGGENAAAQMATAATQRDFRAAWIDGWHPSSDTATASLSGLALEDFGPNGDSEAFGWTYGRPMGDVDTGAIEDGFRTMYENTQEELDGATEVHRGVGNRTTTHGALESWSEREDIAEEFDDFVMTAEVDPGDVLATWGTLGDEWPEDHVKGKEEWMVLGGALE